MYIAPARFPTLFPTLLGKKVQFPTPICCVGVGTFSFIFFTIKGKKKLGIFNCIKGEKNSQNVRRNAAPYFGNLF